MQRWYIKTLHKTDAKMIHKNDAQIGKRYIKTSKYYKWDTKTDTNRSKIYKEQCCIQTKFGDINF